MLVGPANTMLLHTSPDGGVIFQPIYDNRHSSFLASFARVNRTTSIKCHGLTYTYRGDTAYCPAPIVTYMLKT